MARADAHSSLTIDALRQRWLPHKQRFERCGGGHPTAVRFHRACSWLEETERLDADRQADQILIFQWTAFNALYGQWDLSRHEPLADRVSWQVFLGRMLELDADGHVVELLRADRGLVLAILGNAYLNRYFWHEPDGEKAGPSGRGGRRKGEAWYAEQAWPLLLEQVIERIYLLRCQLVHGAATLGSRLNRTALRHSTTLLGKLLPTFLLIWIDQGADEDWGIMCYPPVETSPPGRSVGNWRPSNPR